MSETFDINGGNEKKNGLIDTYKEIKKERQERDQNLNLLANAAPSLTNLKLYIESLLALPNCEDILWDMVETILRDEQMALDEETKQSIYWQKRMLGFVFTHANAYGDQYSMLKEMARQLGYTKITY